MAQHDYVIDNSTGANVRADINSVLQAIASNNSGSSAPSTTYAFQLFADTTNNVMKIRNSANNAFIELFQLDGTFTLEDGSASTPALAFRDDLDTGIYSDAANTFNVATGGVERMQLGSETVFNETGVDVDFRIEGDTDTTLFVADAGNDRIGIGTSSPTSKLDIAGDVTITSTQPKLFLTDTNSASDYSLQNANGNIEFVDETNSATRMRIVSDGDATFTSNAGNATFTFKKGNAPAGQQSVSIRFDRNGTVIGGVGGATQLTGGIGGDVGLFAVNGNTLRFGTGTGGVSTLKASIDQTGNLTIADGNLVIGTGGHGIDFSATTNGGVSTPSEILQDYEIGTWTPVFRDGTSMTINSATYVKVGHLVMLQAYIVTGTNTSSNSHIIDGLPYAARNGNNFFIGSVYMQGGEGSTTDHKFVQVSNNAATLQVLRTNGLNITLSSNSGGYILFTVSYRAADGGS